jgi:hypothetical protein
MSSIETLLTAQRNARMRLARSAHPSADDVRLLYGNNPPPGVWASPWLIDQQHPERALYRFCVGLPGGPWRQLPSGSKSGCGCHGSGSPTPPPPPSACSSPPPPPSCLPELTPRERQEMRRQTRADREFRERVRKTRDCPLAPRPADLSACSTVGESAYLEIRRFGFHSGDKADARLFRVTPTGAIESASDGHCRIGYVMRLARPLPGEKWELYDYDIKDPITVIDPRQAISGEGLAISHEELLGLIRKGSSYVYYPFPLPRERR